MARTLRATCHVAQRSTMTREMVYSENWTYISEMKSHSEFGRDSKDDTETDTKDQSDHGGIVIGAKVASDEYSCPYSNSDDDDG